MNRNPFNFEPEAQNSIEENLTDLLADFMHYCRTEGIDFEDILLSASGHLDYEVAEDERREQLARSGKD